MKLRKLTVQPNDGVLCVLVCDREWLQYTPMWVNAKWVLILCLWIKREMACPQGLSGPELYHLASKDLQSEDRRLCLVCSRCAAAGCLRVVYRMLVDEFFYVLRTRCACNISFIFRIPCVFWTGCLHFVTTRYLCNFLSTFRVWCFLNRLFTFCVVYKIFVQHVVYIFIPYIFQQVFTFLSTGLLSIRLFEFFAPDVCGYLFHTECF